MRKQRKVVLFLLKFFISYFLLFILYSGYLRKTQQKGAVFTCAPITTTVAKQTSDVLDFFGYENAYEQHDKELSVKIFLNNHYTSRVIEGCNSISVIILFVSFLIAFSGTWLKTVLFGVVGSALIYGINVLRIALLTVLLYKYPQEQMLLHNLLFPAIIYGFVFLLWVLWVHKFSGFKK